MSKSTVTTNARIDQRRVVAVALLCAAAVLPAAADEIYKSTDAQGHPVYSDRPLSPSAERIVVSAPKPSAQASASSAAQVQATTQRLEEESRQEQAKQAEQRAAQAAKANRAESCRRARDRYLAFAEANRLYRRDEQGDRVYYTGEEIDAERTAAEQSMKELCDESPR